VTRKRYFIRHVFAHKETKKMVISLAAVNLVFYANSWNDGKMEYWNIGFLLLRAEYRIGQYVSLFLLEQAKTLP
jgi:hypothetical protein